MVLKNFTYYTNGRKTKIPVKVCESIFSKISGLMFRKNSPSLLFIFSKEKKLSIHSYFCKPFTAIWLDDKKRVLKKEYVRNWKFNISGRGRYLLEIPEISVGSERFKY